MGQNAQCIGTSVRRYKAGARRSGRPGTEYPAAGNGLATTPGRAHTPVMGHQCSRVPACCLGAMRTLDAIHSPGTIRAILERLGLPARAPPIASPAATLGLL